jgi:small subunit ribosomal protein S21
MATNVKVEVRKGQLERSLKYFKKRVNESGVIQEYRQRQEFVKPSKQRRLAKDKAIRDNQIEMEKNRPSKHV